MEAIELTAKNVDEARQAAAQKLGVAPEDVQINVLEETKGLFGKSSVRVSASANGKSAAPAKEAKPARGGKAAKAAPAAPEAESAGPAVEAPAEEKKGARGRGRGAAKSGTSQTSPETIKNLEDSMNGPAASEVAESSETEGENQVMATQKDADQLLALVNQILGSGDLEVSAKASLSGGRYVNVEIDGKDVAFLVGKHGEVLNALQYLINIAAARKFANGVRITLDGNNYRERREAALTALANKIAQAVKDRGEEAVLDALPAFERRVVHKALSTIDGIETYSEGEEPNRRVVIAPVEA